MLDSKRQLIFKTCQIQGIYGIPWHHIYCVLGTYEIILEAIKPKLNHNYNKYELSEEQYELKILYLNCSLSGKYFTHFFSYQREEYLVFQVHTIQ